MESPARALLLHIFLHLLISYGFLADVRFWGGFGTGLANCL